jgi:uncharacterized protein YqeY
MKKFSNVKEIQLERQVQRSNETIYSMLGVLIGEIDRLPTREDPTEDQIYTVVNRMYNNAKEMAQYKEQSRIEMEYLQDYIKSQLTSEELTNIILEHKAGGAKNIGEFMKFLTLNYKGRYDGKVASQIINQILKQ